MKTAVKVFLILSIVASALCIFFGLIFGVTAIGMGELMTDEDFMGDIYYDEDIYYGDEFYGDDMTGLIVGGTSVILLVTGIIMFILYGALGGVGLALSIIALRKLNRAQCSDDFSIGWRVVVLLFVNMIAGILLLCMKDEDFCDKKPQLAVEGAPIDTEGGTGLPNIDDLIKYKELLDAGAITQEEYDEIKRKILGKGE